MQRGQGEALDTEFCNPDGRFCQMMDTKKCTGRSCIHLYRSLYGKGLRMFWQPKKRRGGGREAGIAKRLTEILFENVKDEY